MVLCAKNVTPGGLRTLCWIVSLSVRICAMKFGEQIGLGQRNCRLGFGGDPGSGITAVPKLLFSSLITEPLEMESRFKNPKGML